MIKLGAVLVAVVVPALAFACADDKTPPPDAPPTAASTEPSSESALSTAETEYLRQIEEIDHRIGEKVKTVQDALSNTYPTEGRLFAVVGEQAIFQTFQAMLAEVEPIAPPERFIDDHQRYAESLAESARIAEDLEAAIGDSDLLRFSLGTTELVLSRTQLLVTASPTFCVRALVADLDPGCAAVDAPPGGAYGTDLSEAFREFSADFSPRTSGFPPAFSPEDRIAALLELQPPIIEALEEVLAELQGLDPPDELRKDHERIVQYVEETLDTALSISAAAEANDFDETESLFRGSGIAFCSAQNKVSDEAKSIIPFWFDAPNC